LLPDTESEAEEAVKLSPEENTLHDLVNLAVTIRDDGQVNPLTVIDISQGVTRLYRIETGERRYWAAWLLRDFFTGYESDGMIDCIVVPAENSSIFRQAKENTARKGLTAIAMARQAALLILTVHDYEMPAHAVNNDFYRQSLDLTLRGKREFTDSILSAMGSIGKMHFSHYKALLRLTDEAWELADRHNLDEFRLRPVLQLPEEAQAEMVQHIIQFNLSGRQVREICERGLDDEIQPDVDNTLSHIRRFVKAIKKVGEEDEENFFRSLLSEEQSPALARARIDNTISFLLRVQKRFSDE
jgi:ParB family transcriptional regulator, chromosome partitioning protein